MQLEKALINVAKVLGTNFSLKGRPLSYTEIFTPTGLLPGLAKRADQLASLLLGYTLGATYEDVEKSILGVKVSFDDFTPDTLRLACILDVLCEFIKMSPSKQLVALDELLYD